MVFITTELYVKKIKPLMFNNALFHSVLPWGVLSFYFLTRGHGRVSTRNFIIFIGSPFFFFFKKCQISKMIQKNCLNRKTPLLECGINPGYVMWQKLIFYHFTKSLSQNRFIEMILIHYKFISF